MNEQPAGDPWLELTPGALGRLALESEPATVAADLVRWCEALEVERAAEWFEALGAALREASR